MLRCIPFLNDSYSIFTRPVINKLMSHYDRFLFWMKNVYCPKKKLQQSSNHLLSIIVPVYNGDPYWLKKAIDSVIGQTYTNWELLLIDDSSNNYSTIEALKEINDPRIHVIFQNTNRGTSETLNEGIRRSKGEYIGFLDQDDLLDANAMVYVEEAANRYNPDFIYTDECPIYEEKIFRWLSTPSLKPDYSPTLLHNHNYIIHLMFIRRDLVEKTGLFDSDFNGAQDYDLAIKAGENAHLICHIRKCLYFWRIHKTSMSHHKGSSSGCETSGERVLKAALKRCNLSGLVRTGGQYCHYLIDEELTIKPKISIIIPFKDQPELLEKCLNSIIIRTSYDNYEILLVNNNSILEETFELIKKYSKINSTIRLLDYTQPFNYSAMNNMAVSHASGEYIVLMNNDIEIITSNWIESLLSYAIKDNIGAVGGKLLYPDGRLQHGGIALGIGIGLSGHPGKGFTKETMHIHDWLLFPRNVSAVTGALLMVQKKKYEMVNGLDEQNLKIGFNDVDFCLKLLELGFFNVYSPYCEAIHAESASRGYMNTPEKKELFERELNYFVKRHNKILNAGDPWFNPHYSLKNESLHYNPEINQDQIYGIMKRGENNRWYYEPYC